MSCWPTRRTHANVHLHSNMCEANVTLRGLAGLATRGTVVVGGLWYFLSIPEGQAFSARIGQFFGIDETFTIFRFFSIIDFALALALGILISHSVFWPCIVRQKERWPRWGEPALRALDYLWYAGAAAGLVFVAAQAQGELFSEFRSVHEGELENRRNWFRSSLEEVPGRCDQTFNAPTDGSSDDYRTAYAVVIAVCGELDEAGTDRRELWIADRAVLSRCDDANVDYSPPGAGQSFSQDLWDHRPLLDAYSSIIGVCLNDHHIRRAKERLEEIEPFEEAVEFTEENPLLSGYVAWFALLLAFRLSRTTAEVFEAVRSARRS